MYQRNLSVFVTTTSSKFQCQVTGTVATYNKKFFPIEFLLCCIFTFQQQNLSTCQQDGMTLVFNISKSNIC